MGLVSTWVDGWVWVTAHQGANKAIRRRQKKGGKRKEWMREWRGRQGENMRADMITVVKETNATDEKQIKKSRGEKLAVNQTCKAARCVI